MKELFRGKIYDYGYDIQGRYVARSVDSFDTDNIKAFQGVPFITLNKEDAANIMSMLEESITRLSPEGTTLSDRDIYGDRAISLERLYDALHGGKD